MDLVINPHPLQGEVFVPASKSIMHRALICAALAEGESVIRNAYISEDITATMDCLSQLGASFRVEGDTIYTKGIPDTATYEEERLFDCGESGSTVRFLIPIAAALGVPSVFTGRGKLPTRPLDLYQQVFADKGVHFDYHGLLPASLQGKLKPGRYEISGSVSSQFITGLLFALPLLSADSELVILPPFFSKGYVEITLSCLKAFGITIIQQSETSYLIPGNQRYLPQHYTVESDYSQAAFFLVANCLGNRLTLKHFSDPSVQGDSAILSILKEVGCTATVQEGILTTLLTERKAFTVDAGDIPDLVPILCVLASFCHGESVISQVERLKIKESDRILSSLALIRALGGTIRYEAENDRIVIQGDQTFTGGVVNSFNDHRIAMAAAIAATVCIGDVILQDAGCVKKSYPTFFEEYARLGGVCNVISME